MKDKRQAIDTIKGYFYQFNKTIQEILGQEDINTEICIEGIEDIDIKKADESLAMQCKYYSKQTYNHSVIKQAIIWMVTHYSQNKDSNLKYKIYANFKDGHSKLPQIISVDFLKEHFLTYTSKGFVHRVYEKLNLSDEQLSLFLEKLDIDINACTFEELENSILVTLKNELSCPEEILSLYYMKAGSIIKKLAINDDINDRMITKKKFMDLLFDINKTLDNWYITKLGIDRYCKLMRRTFFTKKNVSPSERFFIIDCGGTVSLNLLKTVTYEIARKWSKLTQRNPTPFCPYIVFVNLKETVLLNLKKELQRENFKFIDGYEFKGADFCVDSILIEANYNNQIKIKIISLEELDLVINKTNKVKEIYQFYMSIPTYDNESVCHTKIKISNISNILDII